MPVVAPRKPLRIRGDRLERLIEFGVEALSRLNASLGVPRQGIRILVLSSRTDDKINHPVRPCAGRVGALPTRAKQSFGRRRKPGCVVEPRQSIHRWAVASRRQKRMPTERESVARVPRPAACGPHREFPVSWSCLCFTSLARPTDRPAALRQQILLTTTSRASVPPAGSSRRCRSLGDGTLPLACVGTPGYPNSSTKPPGRCWRPASGSNAPGLSGGSLRTRNHLYSELRSNQ